MELVLVMVIIGIMAAILVPVGSASLRAYDSTLGNITTLDKLRYATERLAREVREVQYDSTGGTFAFSSASSNGAAFTRNFYDSGGTVTTGTVTVSVSGTSLNLNYSSLPTAGDQPLTDELSSLTLDYLDQNGASISTLTLSTLKSNVRFVKITVTLLHNGQTYTQSTQVQLKNLI